MGFEVSILFALGALLCWAFGDFFIQRSTRKVGDIETIAFIGIIGCIALLPFAAKEFHMYFSLPNLLTLFFVGVIVFITDIFCFEALKKGKLSIIDVIFEIELPMTILLGFIFFKETLSVLQFFIISLIFIGIMLIATKSFSHWKTKLEKGVLLAFLAAIFMGGTNFLAVQYSRQISPILAIWTLWAFTALFSLIFIWKRDGTLKFIKDAGKFKWLILLTGIFDTAAWVFYAFATSQNAISIITAITESYPAIGIFLGAGINKEKINWHQWLGAGLALSASLMLILLV